MSRARYLSIAIAASAALLAASQSPVMATAPSPDDQVPSLGPVFLIVGENTQLSQINQGNAPFLSSAMTGQSWASLTNYWATTHYSESNYVAMMSGQFTTCQQKDGTAANCHQDVDNLFHQMSSGATTHTYTTWSESMPDACHLLNTGGDSTLNHYAAKHNPQLFFDNVEGDAVTPVGSGGWLDNGFTQGGSWCRTTNLSASASGGAPNDMSVFDNALTSDASTISDFNLVVPNECEDGHSNCKPAGNPITQFDDFLAREVPKIQSYIGTHGGTLIVTFDEGVTSSPVRAVKFGNGGNVAFVAWGPKVHAGVYTGQHTHYSLLRTLEDSFGIHDYLGDASQVTPISEIWTTGP